MQKKSDLEHSDTMQRRNPFVSWWMQNCGQGAIEGPEKGWLGTESLLAVNGIRISWGFALLCRRPWRQKHLQCYKPYMYLAKGMAWHLGCHNISSLWRNTYTYWETSQACGLLLSISHSFPCYMDVKQFVVFSVLYGVNSYLHLWYLNLWLTINLLFLLLVKS